MQFVKLFNSILDSTIWQEPPATKLVWITLLAMSDRHGEVFTSIPGLAKRAGVEIGDCEKALHCMLSPDPYSRTKDHEGRRIAEIDGGFALLNHGKYRALLSADERREYMRQKQADRRSKLKSKAEDVSKPVKQCQTMSTMSTHTEAEAEAESKADLFATMNGKDHHPYARTNKKPFKAPTLDEAIHAGRDYGVTEAACKAWWEAREANGWMKGTAGGGTTPIVSWVSDLSHSKAWAEDQATKNKKADKTVWTPDKNM